MKETSLKKLLEPSALTPREMFLAAGLIALGLVGHLWVTGAFRLLPRHLWLDEVLTWMLVSDPSLKHSLQALSGAVDTNPPGFHLLLRGFCIIADGITPTTMRVFALTSIYLSQVGMYAALRCALPIWMSMVGVFTLWSMPLIVHHAFEARFYGPMLACAIWVAFLLQRLPGTNRSGFVAFFLAILSAMLCTIHYFGILALLCMVPAFLIFTPATRPRKMLAIGTTLAGPIALAFCLPIYHAQRTGLRATTWVTPINATMLQEYVIDLLPMWILIVLAGASLMVAVLRVKWRRCDVRPLAPLLSLTGVAGIVLIFSLTVQPALIPRYAIASAAGFSGLIAIGIAVLPRRIAWLAGLVPVAACLFPYPGLQNRELRLYSPALEAHVRRWVGPGGIDDQTDQLIANLRQQRDEKLVLFDVRQTLYPVLAAAPDLRTSCVFVDATSSPDVAEFQIYEADMAHRVEQYYGWPHVVLWESLPLNVPLLRVNDEQKIEVIQRQLSR